MPVEGFYYTYGDDSDMIERKWLPEIQKRYANATWLRYDATIDEIPIGRLVTEYCSNDLFAEGKVIVLRNADSKLEASEALAQACLDSPIRGNALVFIAGGLNGTTRLGKLVKDKFIVKEFTKPEIKPFDMLDALNSKSASKVLHHCNRLFEAEHNALALYSLLCGHFLLLQQIKERERQSPESIARELKQHHFRVKKAMVANRYWTEEELAEALHQLGVLGNLLRSWQYDEQMLISMTLIKLCL